MDNFIFRPVREEDRAEILEMTANTWEHGDYISYVFDDWLADTKGIFLAIEDTENHKIAGIDKLTMLAPGQGWFEGLRIHKDYRRRGLATQVQRHMIQEAKRLGASTVRFLTRTNNVAIHIAGSHDHFQQIALVRGFNWKRHGTTLQPEESEAYDLRPATYEEAGILYWDWRTTSSYRTAHLINHSWSFRSTGIREWRLAARAGHLLVKADSTPNSFGLAVPCTLLRPGGEKVTNAWTVSAISANHNEWAPLLRGLLNYAQESNIDEIEGMLPDEHMLYEATIAAGIQPHADEQTHFIFELRFFGRGFKREYRKIRSLRHLK